MKLFLLWRALAIGGLLGLMVLIILWNGWLTPVQKVPRWLELLILLSPLLFLVRGILHASAATHVHAVLISLLYATLGVWYAVSPPEQVYGYWLIGLSVCLYVGGFMTARVLGKQAKQKGVSV